jgi:hypothetical protein
VLRNQLPLLGADFGVCAHIGRYRVNGREFHQGKGYDANRRYKQNKTEQFARNKA